MWKRLLCAAILAHASAGGLAAAPAEPYPTKPIRLLVGFPAGGSDDYIARVIGSKMTERLGPPVIVDNRPAWRAISVPRSRRVPTRTGIPC